MVQLPWVVEGPGVAMARLFRDAVGLVQRVAYGKPPEGGASSRDEVPLVGLDGKPLGSGALDGKVLLIVNVASRCGLTPQYEALQALHERLSPRGFSVVGVPCNQFLGQEPGDADQIRQFCTERYQVTFPLLEKQDVNAGGRSPLYQWLVGSPAGRGEDISWNFEKFLVDRAGEVVARFAPDVKPDAPELVAAAERALG
jgi:glutathione peroxidase